MKTIGLIGGMSWESTVPYYQIINTIVKETLGGHHSAKCIIYSVDFHEIEQCQSSGNWEKAGEILGGIAAKLEAAGADFIILCTNTMHKVSEQITSAITVPFLHIADVTVEALVNNNVSTVALLGTKYTMEQDFYKDKIISAGINVLVPDEDDRTKINEIIFNQLCLGVVDGSSKEFFLSVIEKLRQRGAEGVILGCTEIGMLVEQKNVSIKLFDTTKIHGEKAAEFALE